MTFFDVLTLIGGLSLFLFGMNLMGDALEKRAGQGLKKLLGKLTGSKAAGFLTGVGVTAVIQSSSATTVMVVGFVNSGLMALRQAIYVIMGANVGTTVTAWLLSLAGIDGGSTWVQLLKPTSFTPVLALIGVIFYMFCKDSHKKDTGAILLGFATLMFGMDTMSGAVAGLKDVPGFAELFLAFTNPLLGVLVGAVLTAVIQSSSASVGILQALAFFPHLRVYSVAGNCDYGALEPLDGLAGFDQTVVFYTHGHMYGVKYDLDTLADAAAARGAEVALFGHSHIPHAEQRGNVFLFNPGSCGRCYTGPDTYGLLTLENGAVTAYEHKEVPKQ